MILAISESKTLKALIIKARTLNLKINLPQPPMLTWMTKHRKLRCHRRQLSINILNFLIVSISLGIPAGPACLGICWTWLSINVSLMWNRSLILQNQLTKPPLIKHRLPQLRSPIVTCFHRTKAYAKSVIGIIISTKRRNHVWQLISCAGLTMKTRECANHATPTTR